MGLFYMQLDVTSSQLLVTDGIFRDTGFREQLSETVASLLELRVIPIFNENDAVSARKAPYEVCIQLLYNFHYFCT
jgi:delta-1-pyrroline-5-carboxylate synthetase